MSTKRGKAPKLTAAGPWSSTGQLRIFEHADGARVLQQLFRRIEWIDRYDYPGAEGRRTRVRSAGFKWEAVPVEKAQA